VKFYLIVNLFIANPSKAALKMKKNREAKKAKKELESNNPTVNEHVTNTTTSIKIELTDNIKYLIVFFIIYSYYIYSLFI